MSSFGEKVEIYRPVCPKKQGEKTNAHTRQKTFLAKNEIFREKPG